MGVFILVKTEHEKSNYKKKYSDVQITGKGLRYKYLMVGLLKTRAIFVHKESHSFNKII